MSSLCFTLHGGSRLFRLQLRGSACIVSELDSLGLLIFRGTFEWLLASNAFFLTFPPLPTPGGGVWRGPGNHKTLGSELTLESVGMVQLVMERCYHLFILTFMWLPDTHSRYQVPISKGAGVLVTCHKCICFIVLYFRKLRHLKMGEHLYPIFPRIYNWVLLYSSFQMRFSDDTIWEMSLWLK